MRKSILYILFLFNCVSCGSNKNLNDYNSDLAQIEEIAQTKFTKPHKVVANENNNYSLVLSRTKTLKTLFPTVHFFVFDHKENKVIIEDELQAGSVSWISKNEIEATKRGMESKTDSGSRNHKYIFNCKTKEYFEDE